MGEGVEVAPLLLKRISPSATRPSRNIDSFDSRRLCGPRSRVVCLYRLSFKGGANNLRESLNHRRLFARKCPAASSSSQADGAGHTFQRNYKTERRRLSINILHGLTAMLFAI